MSLYKLIVLILRLNSELEVKLKSVHEAEKASQAKSLRQAWEEERKKLEEEEKKKLEERLAEERKKEDVERSSEKKTSQSKKVDYRLEAEKVIISIFYIYCIFK